MKRTIRATWFLMGLFGLWQVANATSDNGTLTVGVGSTRICGSVPIPWAYGFDSGSFGSYSPTGLTGGDVVAGVLDTASGYCGGVFSEVVITGFSSNPGTTWLSSVTCNGVTNNDSNASFSYGGGVAIWSWSQLFGLKGKSNVSCTIDHS
jgi:hypothetical protein